MGRSFELQSNTTSASSALASMESPDPEVDQTGPEPEVDQKGPEPEVDQKGPEPEVEKTGPEPEVEKTGPEPEPVSVTPSVPTPSVLDSNGDASPPPRLASITGLFMNQKSHQWNSTSADCATPRSPSTTDSDLAPPSFTRPVRFDDDDSEPRRTASFGSTVASTLNAHRRAAAAVAAGGSGAASASLTETDLRRFVFHHPRAKRLVSGLRVHAFTRQAFVSSFTVGLAIGSVVAIVLKILKDLAGRMLYS